MHVLHVLGSCCPSMAALLERLLLWCGSHSRASLRSALRQAAQKAIRNRNPYAGPPARLREQACALLCGKATQEPGLRHSDSSGSPAGDGARCASGAGSENSNHRSSSCNCTTRLDDHFNS